ncbi:MAG: hypothetical protein AAGE98_03000 [Actinomycetota bacterium]
MTTSAIAERRSSNDEPAGWVVEVEEAMGRNLGRLHVGSVTKPSTTDETRVAEMLLCQPADQAVFSDVTLVQ